MTSDVGWAWNPKRMHARYLRAVHSIGEYISRDEVLDGPPKVTTVTLTAPVPAGLSAVIVVGLMMVTFVAAVWPKLTAAEPPGE